MQSNPSYFLIFCLCYTSEECDKQYDRCLNAHGTGITIRTFFQLAKEHGISLITAKRAKTTELIKMTEYAQCAYS
ncbi:MAG: PriCT-2 domain-containing protein, partial [Anaerovoracaceae bacterium]